jgi:ubiquinone/menaquinone biosynthesis C-methylase UbiE
MEWKPFIAIYESQLFRAGPGFLLVSGIPFDREYEIITQAAKLKGDEILLDLGCGSGIYSRPFSRRLNGGIVVGLDLSLPMLYYASSRARVEKIDNLLLIHGNAFDLPFTDNEFDAVICGATIHHFSISDLLRVIKEVRRVLKPGGRFMAASLRNWIPGQLSKKFVDWYYQQVGTNFFRSDDLESLFKQAGLNNIECHHAKRYWLVMTAAKPQLRR